MNPDIALFKLSVLDSEMAYREAGRTDRSRSSCIAVTLEPKRRRRALELGHQLVAACLGDQDGGSGGVLLELLPQPINVRLERVRGDTGIVTPDLLQQGLARYRALTGAVEIAQDRRFLFREPDFVALLIEQD